MVATPPEPSAKRQKPGERPWDLLLKNARLATMSESNAARPYGQLVDNANELCAVAVREGKIAWLGTMAQLGERAVDVLPTPKGDIAWKTYDAKGCWVTPGLVDCHTHIIFGGNRAGEWELKLKGASYEEIARAGGGIVNTVDGTRAASMEDLVEGARPRLQALMAEGVTAIEIKSGYGLSEEHERKMLQAARAVGRQFDLEVRTTFLGAHAVPREYKERGPTGADDYIAEVVRMTEALKSEGLVDAVDAFCETIAFDVQQTSRVFSEAARLGIPVRLHGDQLNDLGGGALAARFGALSCDHCECTSDASVDAMAQAGTVAVLLPSANYFMKETRRPPIAAMRKAGVQIALATNSNPGSSPCCSVLLNLNMGCTIFGLTPEEALLGVTRVGAKAMGLQETHGTLDVGKVADFVVWDVGSPGEIAYYLGLNRLKACFRGGRLRKVSCL